MVTEHAVPASALNHYVVNADLAENLAMAQRAPILLLALVLEHPHLRGPGMTQDGGGYLGIFKQGEAHIQLFLPHRADVIEFDASPWLTRQPFHPNDITGRDPVFLAACPKDRIH